MTELPKIIASQKVFDGRVFNVTVDTVREGERTYQREVVHHHGSAVILPASTFPSSPSPLR